MSVKKNLLYNVINNISAIIFPVITVPYVSRILGVENIGVVGFATSYASYFALFANLGVSIYGSREIAKLKDDKEKRDKLFSELFILMLLSSALCSLLYLMSIFTIQSLLNERAFLLVAGISLFLSSFSLDWYFAGRENFKMIAIRSIVIKLIALILMFALVKSKNDAIIYCGITVFSGLLNNIWNFGYLIKKEVKIRFDHLVIVRHIKPLLTLLSTNIAISIYTTLDTLMLGFISNYTEVGYYNSATKISRLLLPFAVATTAVMVPKISYAFTLEDKKEYNMYVQKSFSMVSFFAFPMAAGLFIISPSFVPFFFGNEFLPVTPVLQTLSVVLLLVGLSNFFGIQVLATSGFESKLLKSILLGASANFLLNLIIIPRFGAVGAAMTSVTAELIILFTTFFMAVKHAQIKLIWTPFFESIVSSLPMIFLFLILQNLKMQYAFIILVPIGTILYFLLQLLVFKNKIAAELFSRFLQTLKIKYSWI